MDRDDLELFERSIRQAAEGAASRGTLDAALVELGWEDALAEEPRAAVSVLFSAQGAAGVTSRSLLRVLGSDVLPALGGTAQPGRVVEGQLVVDGLALAPADGPLLVATAADGTDAVVEVAAGVLQLTPVAGLDPELGLVRVTGSVPAFGEPKPVAAWDGVVAAGQVALGHELVGVARAMLAQAREHALDRVQFGQPIAAFQAIRHRLAETLVAIESADALLIAAWEDPSPQVAAMAKALAGRSARTAARHCQQVLAGIGFTTEHPLHRFVRRTYVLDELLGAGRTLTRTFGEDVLTGQHLPRMLPL